MTSSTSISVIRLFVPDLSRQTEALMWLLTPAPADVAAPDVPSSPRHEDVGG